jgi:hypothetical protein
MLTSLDAQMRTHYFVRQLTDRARCDPATLAENAELADNPACERQLVLHEKNGQPLLSLRMMSPISCTMSG